MRSSIPTVFSTAPGRSSAARHFTPLMTRGVANVRRSERGNQLKRLEDEADVSPAKPRRLRQHLLVVVLEDRAIATVPLQQACQDRNQGRLAATGRPDVQASRALPTRPPGRHRAEPARRRCLDHTSWSRRDSSRLFDSWQAGHGRSWLTAHLPARNEAGCIFSTDRPGKR